MNNYYRKYMKLGGIDKKFWRIKTGLSNFFTVHCLILLQFCPIERRDFTQRT